MQQEQKVYIIGVIASRDHEPMRLLSNRFNRHTQFLRVHPGGLLALRTRLAAYRHPQYARNSRLDMPKSMPSKNGLHFPTAREIVKCGSSHILSLPVFYERSDNMFLL
jgi:hypothetical protein